MRIFISGGNKNGKSYHAQRLARAQCLPDTRQKGLLYYVATMNPCDGEDDERIRRHREEREGWGFTTIERPLDIEGILNLCDPGGSFLLDSLTALLANEMFCGHDCVNESAAKKIAGGLTEIMGTSNNIVIVSDYIYSGVSRYERLTELFRKSLAEIDRLAAGLSDVVLEAAYTNIIVHKGGGAYQTIL